MSISTKEQYEAIKHAGYEIGYKDGFLEGYKRSIQAIEYFLHEAKGVL